MTTTQSTLLSSIQSEFEAIDAQAAGLTQPLADAQARIAVLESQLVSGPAVTAVFPVFPSDTSALDAANQKIAELQTALDAANARPDVTAQLTDSIARIAAERDALAEDKAALVAEITALNRAIDAAQAANQPPPAPNP